LSRFGKRQSRMTLFRTALTSSLCCLLPLLTGCAVGRHYTADLQLERYFYRHEADFNALLREVQSDAGFQAICLHYVRNGESSTEVSSGDDLSRVERLGFTRERWLGYNRRLRLLGLTFLMKSDERIELRVANPSLFNGDSIKSYAYLTLPPRNLKTDLDRYDISDSENIPGGWAVYKPLHGNWYLFLFVSG